MTKKFNLKRLKLIVLALFAVTVGAIGFSTAGTHEAYAAHSCGTCGGDGYTSVGSWQNSYTGDYSCSCGNGVDYYSRRYVTRCGKCSSYSSASFYEYNTSTNGLSTTHRHYSIPDGSCSGSITGNTGVQYSAATCTANRFNYAYCTTCNKYSSNHSSSYLYEVSGTALGHNASAKGSTLRSSATCTAAATYYYECSRCGTDSTSYYSSGSALGHSYTQQTTTSTYLRTSATCTAAATYYYNCSRSGCNATHSSYYYSSGSALGHTYTNASWTYNVSGDAATSTSRWHICTRCSNATDDYQYKLTLIAGDNVDSVYTGDYAEVYSGTIYWVATGESVEIEATPEDGYTFNNWTGYGTSTSNPYTFTMSQARTYTASVTANTLKVYYDTNGGEISSGTYAQDGNGIITSGGSQYCQEWTYNETQTDGLNNITDFGLTKPNYVFVGWSLDPNETEAVFDQDDATIVPTDLNEAIYDGDAEVTLYAQWKYTITFIGNGATSGSMDDMVVYSCEEPITLPANEYEMCLEADEENVIFLGWNTAADGSGTWYRDENSSLTDIANADGTITLYAQWAVYDTTDGKAYVTEDETMHFTGICSGFDFASSSDVPWLTAPSPYHDAFNTTVTEVDFNAGVNPKQMDYWFYNFKRLADLPDFSGCTATKSMVSTFEGCSSLSEGPDLTGCESLQNITKAFANCTKMTTSPEFYENGGNNTTLTTLTSGFQGCVNLLYAPDMSNLTGTLNTESMFEDCRNISSELVINAAGFSNYSNMFKGAAYTTQPLMLTSTLDASAGLPNGIYTDATLAMLENLEATETADVSNVEVFKLDTIIAHPAQTKYPVSTADTASVLTKDDFTFIAEYTDESEESISFEDAEITISPSAVPTTEGEFTVTISINNGSGYYDYHGDGSSTDMTVTLYAVDPTEIEVEDADVTLVEKEVDMENPLIELGYQLFKIDDKGNAVEGATFELEALVDILNHKGEVIVPAGTVLQTQMTATPSEGGYAGVAFAGLPSNLWTANGASTTAMYRISETATAPGYSMGSGQTSFTYSGAAVDDGSTSHDYIISEADNPVVNEVNDTVQLVKEWADQNNIAGERPSSLTFYITNSVTKDVTEVVYDVYDNATTDAEIEALMTANEWVIMTDLPRFDENGNEIAYTVEEAEIVQVSTYADNEKTYTGYKDPEYYMDDNGVWHVINRHGYSSETSVYVTKTWDDTMNGIADYNGIRPIDGVWIVLYADGEEVARKEMTINDEWVLDRTGNTWSIGFENLPYYGEEGDVIQYSVEELIYDGTNPDVDKSITGNKDTGYEPTITTVYDGNTESSWEFNVTNTHVGKTNIVLGKRIKAEDINWSNGEPTFMFEVNGVLAENNEEVRYVRQVTFTKDWVEANTESDGYVVLGTTFMDLKAGTYTGSEIDVSRYEVSSITDVKNGLSNGTISGETVTFELINGVRYGTAIFTNEKYEWQDYSQSSVVVNTIGDTTEMAVPYYEVVNGETKLMLLLSKDSDTTYSIADFATSGSNLPDTVYVSYDTTKLVLKDGVAYNGCLYEDGVIELSGAVATKIADNWKTAISFTNN